MNYKKKAWRVPVETPTDDRPAIRPKWLMQMTMVKMTMVKMAMVKMAIFFSSGEPRCLRLFSAASRRLFSTSTCAVAPVALSAADHIEMSS